MLPQKVNNVCESHNLGVRAALRHGKKLNDSRAPIGVVEQFDRTATKRGIWLTDPVPDPCGSVKPFRISALGDHFRDLRAQIRDEFTFTG